MQCKLQQMTSCPRRVLQGPAIANGAPVSKQPTWHARPCQAIKHSMASLQPLQMPQCIQQQILPQQQQQQRQGRVAQLPPPQASASSSSGSSKPDEPAPPTPGGWLTWFDRLSQQTQLMIMGGLLFFAAVVMPFLQPTFLYGSNSAFGSTQQVTQVQQAAPERYQLPRYIPVASELYDFLQDNAMPRTLPDGRSESPGVLRIYMCSMIILALFYACSAVLSLILNGVAGILRAVGIMGPAPPPPKPEDQQ